MKLLNFILAFALLSFVGCKDISEKLSDEKDESALKEVSDDPEVFADDKEYFDEETEDLETTTDAETTTDTEVVEEIKETKQELVKETVAPGKFYIIAGSFKDYKKAEGLYKELTKKGYSETQILEPYNDFSRVVIKSFNDEASARAELKKLRAEYNDNSIWLLVP